ncbi:MAG: carboxylesterase family protein [Actinobacteria bacterium]|nr:carboxylesterase family protein [Actinomycetota bacterium]
MGKRKTGVKGACLFCAATMLMIILCMVSACAQTSDETQPDATTPQTEVTDETAEDSIEILMPNEVVNEDVKVKGIVDDGVVSYKGIPYAQPPLGELRFSPPQAVQPWEGILDCTEYRNCAIQDISEDSTLVPDEDCLYLNIWAPEGAEGKNLPVYFWIHGDSYSSGSGSEARFEGSNFARDDIIVVTIDYRLGALGFLALETSLEEFGTTGNWGTLDQIEALKWVHENIAAFGGNPEAVTLGGSGTGSVSVSNLVMSPLAAGLFDQAILEGGTLLSNQAAVPFTGATLDASMTMSQEYAALFGADDTPEGMELLRSIDAETLSNMASFPEDVTRNERFSFWATQDGFVVPLDPIASLDTGGYNKVSLLIGYGKDDGSELVPVALSEAEYEAYVYKTFKGKDAEDVLGYYAGSNVTPGEKAVDIVTMSSYAVGTKVMEDAFGEDGVDVYAYRFDFTSTDEAGDELDLQTIEDVSFAFANSELVGLELDETGTVIEEQMHILWCNFIKSGDPNVGAADLPFEKVWPTYEYLDPRIYYIDDAITVGKRDQVPTFAFFEKVMYG